MNPVRGLIVWLMLCAALPGARAGTLVQFNLFAGVNFYLGEVDVELYDQDKPVTVNNFIQLIETGAYGNSFFHRCETSPIAIIQGGGFNVINPFSSALIGPPYFDNMGLLIYPTITNEFNVGAFHSNTNGTLAMAKLNDPNSASSQFFFNLGDNSSQLDNTNNNGGYTVFGHVVRGTNILNEFNGLAKGTGIINLVDTYGTSNPLTAAFTNLPAYFAGTNPPPYTNLIYFNVNLLGLQTSLNRTNGARLLTWTTVFGVTNNLEFSTNLPPVWQVLASTNGNGSTVTYTDASTNSMRRFYRVHVLF
jgi:cyclophilin family peptidyl-prolyl cis-trans isomerase